MSSSPEPNFEAVTRENLLDRVRALRGQNHRLVQISATRLPDQVELTYSFDFESRLTQLRLHLPAEGAQVASISSLYWCAFLYENEIHDLFNVQVEGMAVDFKGTLYQTSVKFPFGSTKPPAAKPSSNAPAPPAPPQPPPATS